MKWPFELLRFAGALLPEIAALYRKHKGNTYYARRDMQSLTKEIAADRAAVDERIAREKELERRRRRDG